MRILDSQGSTRKIFTTTMWFLHYVFVYRKFKLITGFRTLIHWQGASINATTELSLLVSASVYLIISTIQTKKHDDQSKYDKFKELQWRVYRHLYGGCALVRYRSLLLPWWMGLWCTVSRFSRNNCLFC